MSIPLPDWLDPQPFRVHLDWGRRAAKIAATQGRLVAIVDVLSFSTCVAIATARGATIIPCTSDDEPATLAGERSATIAHKRRTDAPPDEFSLSPASFARIAAGTSVILPSPNGATCCRLALGSPHIVVGALANATAVGTHIAATLAAKPNLAATLIAAGERLPDAFGDETGDGVLRFALEDFLGAGAILAAIAAAAPALRFSPDARAAMTAFMGLRENLADAIGECPSGRELKARGFADDVRHAVGLDGFAAVPIFDGRAIVNFTPDSR